MSYSKEHEQLEQELKQWAEQNPKADLSVLSSILSQHTTLALIHGQTALGHTDDIRVACSVISTAPNTMLIYEGGQYIVRATSILDPDEMAFQFTRVTTAIRVATRALAYAANPAEKIT